MKRCLIALVLVVLIACNTKEREIPLAQAEQDLEKIALQLFDALRKTDIDTFIKLLAPKERVWNYIELGEDYKISIQEFVQQMRERKGEAYALLFDTEQWRTIFGTAEISKGGNEWITAVDIVCLRDRLLAAGKNVTVRVEVKPPSPGVPMYGIILIDWPGKAETEFGHAGDPEFVYTKYGWRIWTYFGHL